jgi:hypothetical protein
MDDLEAILAYTPRHEGVVAEMSARHGLDRKASEALFDDLVLFLGAGGLAGGISAPRPLKMASKWPRFRRFQARSKAFKAG